MSPTIEVCCNGAGAEGHKKPLRLEYRPDSAKRTRYVPSEIPASSPAAAEMLSWKRIASMKTASEKLDAV